MTDEIKWPDPTQEMLDSPEFNAVWELIKTWEIHAPQVDIVGQYSAGTGNHVRAILDAIKNSRTNTVKEIVKKLQCTSLGSKTRIELIKKLDEMISTTVL